MKTAMLLITMELVAVMKIFIAYFGLYEFASYFNLINTLTITTYGIMALAALTIFLKGQINERQRETSINN